MKPEHLRSIRLTQGVGDPETGGCWMAALTVYEGSEWSEHPDCVCPVIAGMCIAINDLISSDEERGRIIGPMLFDPIGTAGNEQDKQERIKILIRDSFHIFFTDPMEKLRLGQYIDKVKNIDPISCPHYASTLIENIQWIRRPFPDTLYHKFCILTESIYQAIQDWRFRKNLVDTYHWAIRTSTFIACRSAVLYNNNNGYVEKRLIPTLKKLLAVGNKIPIEPAFDERDMKKCLQVV